MNVFATLIAYVATARTREEGATAVEYALLVAGIAAAIAAALLVFGPNLIDALSDLLPAADA